MFLVWYIPCAVEFLQHSNWSKLKQSEPAHWGQKVLGWRGWHRLWGRVATTTCPYRTLLRSAQSSGLMGGLLLLQDSPVFKLWQAWHLMDGRWWRMWRTERFRFRTRDNTQFETRLYYSFWNATHSVPWIPWFLWFSAVFHGFYGFHDICAVFHGFYGFHDICAVSMVSMVSILSLRFPWFLWFLCFSAVSMVSMISWRFPWFPWFPWFVCGFHGFHDLFAVSMVSLLSKISVRFS